MPDVPSHRTVTAPPRAAITAVLAPDGSLSPALSDTSPLAGEVGAAEAEPGDGNVPTPSDEETV
jgi:hypothetical protein